MACVFGTPEEVVGGQVGAVAESVNGMELSGESLREFVGTNLAVYKIPTKIWLRVVTSAIGCHRKSSKEGT